MSQKLGQSLKACQGLSHVVADCLVASRTLQLELRYLSELTGDPRYWNKAEKVLEIIRSQPSKDGLVPIFLSPETGKFMMSDIRLGSRGDSYYEYLYKMSVPAITVWDEPAC